MTAFENFIGSAADARLKAFAGRAALVGDVRTANPSTSDRLKRLTITEHFLANDFVLYLMVEKASAECQYWAYAEKGQVGHEFVFAFGVGNLKSGMRITDCAVVKIDAFEDLRFDHGGEMEDTGQEVRLVRRLDDTAFSSRISELSEETGNHKRTTFAGMLKQLPDAKALDGEASAAPKTPNPATMPETTTKRRSVATDEGEDEPDSDGETN